MLKKYLNILIIIFFTLVFVNGQTIPDNESISFPDSDFQNNYLEFLHKQMTPLENANEEAFLLDSQIWQRKYGEKEYFLAPAMVDIDEYHDRIEQLDDKENGISQGVPHEDFYRLSMPRGFPHEE